MIHNTVLEVIQGDTRQIEAINFEYRKKGVECGE